MRSGVADVLCLVWRSPTGRAGLALSLFIVAFALIGPLVGPSASKISVAEAFQHPSLRHLFGTDNLGRDLFARAAQGTRTAILLALAVVCLSVLAGSVLGILAGMAGGVVDRIVTAIFDIISAYPPVILALALVALYGKGWINVLIVASILFVPQFGRMARSQTLSLKGMPFVDAEMILGLPHRKMVLRHLLPNVAGPMLVLASMNIPVVVTIEAGLSFLGLGVQPPTASLGSLIKDGYDFLDKSWWPTIISGTILAIATLGTTLFGEALRDVTDPKLRGTRR